MRRCVQVFWNPDERRLRALWRLLVFAMIVGALIFVAGVATTFLAASKLAHSHAAVLLLNALASLLVLAGLWVATRFLDRRPFADLGFHLGRAWRADFAFGLGLGALLMSGIFVVESFAGWIEVGRSASLPDGRVLFLVVTAQLSLCVSAALAEEAITRGYLLRNLAEGFHSRWLGPRRAVAIAWAGSSLVFGLNHAANPGSTLLSTANLFAAGLFLGLPYVLTGSLAMPIGLHLAWNFFQGPIFGFNVSGMTLGSSLLEVSQFGPDLWTGGRFGPEGGLLGLSVTVIGACVVLWWVQGGRGKIALLIELAKAPTTAREPAEPEGVGGDTKASVSNADGVGQAEH